MTEIPLDLNEDDVIISSCFDVKDAPVSELFNGEIIRHRFELIQLEQTFEEGSELCSSLGGQPASIATREEFSIAVKLIRNASVFENDVDFMFEENVFIGLVSDDPNATIGNSSTDRFIWLDETPFEFGNAGQEFPWNGGEPSNNEQEEAEDCVHLRQPEFFWSDIRCSVESRILCRTTCDPENPGENEPSYYFDGPAGIQLILCIVFPVIAVALLAFILIIRRRRFQKSSAGALLDFDIRTFLPDESSTHPSGLRASMLTALTRNFRLASISTPRSSLASRTTMARNSNPHDSHSFTFETIMRRGTGYTRATADQTNGARHSYNTNETKSMELMPNFASQIPRNPGMRMSFETVITEHERQIPKEVPSF